MNIALGIILGLIWGAAFSCINMLIMKKALAKNTNNSILACNLLRMVVDFVCLGSVFLIRNAVAVHFVAAIVSAAAALSILNIIFTFILVKKP